MGDFPGGSVVKNPSPKQKTWVPSLCQEDLLEKGMTTYSSILVWRIPWTEESGGLQSTRSQKVGHDWATNTFTFKHNKPNFLWFGSYLHLHLPSCL